MKTLVFATNNQHKLAEMRQLMEGRYEVLGLSYIGCTDDIPETGATLEENAAIKAHWVKEHYGYDCFADDTGLEVEALGGAPGVMSARYAGEGHDSQANMKKLLAAMDGIANRRARFRTVICLISNGETHSFEGIVEGSILTHGRGSEGFGYDPIFQPQGWNITFAEATADQKNAISHRGRATAKLIEYLISTK